MVYGLARSSVMWMLAFRCGWTCYPSALPSHLISDWALQTQQRPQRTHPFLMGFFSLFLFNSNNDPLAGVRPKVGVWRHDWNAHTLHGPVWQEGRTKLESEKPVEGTRRRHKEQLLRLRFPLFQASGLHMSPQWHWSGWEKWTGTLGWHKGTLRKHMKF